MKKSGKLEHHRRSKLLSPSTVHLNLPIADCLPTDLIAIVGRDRVVRRRRVVRMLGMHATDGVVPRAFGRCCLVPVLACGNAV